MPSALISNDHRTYRDASFNVAAGLTLTADLPFVEFGVLLEADAIIRRGLAFGLWTRAEIPEVKRRQALIVEALPDALAREYDRANPSSGIRVEVAA